VHRESIVLTSALIEGRLPELDVWICYACRTWAATESLSSFQAEEICQALGAERDGE
jgi:hypothetical protein